MKPTIDVAVADSYGRECRIVEVWPPDESGEVAVALVERPDGTLNLVTLESLQTIGYPSRSRMSPMDA